LSVAPQIQFIRDVFKTVQQEYSFEGLSFDAISHPDNQGCLDLLEGQGKSIIALLDEETLLGGDALKLLDRLNALLKSHPNYLKPKQKQVLCIWRIQSRTIIPTLKHFVRLMFKFSGRVWNSALRCNCILRN
jgi:hypothetical protein